MSPRSVFGAGAFLSFPTDSEAVMPERLVVSRSWPRKRIMETADCFSWSESARQKIRSELRPVCFWEKRFEGTVHCRHGILYCGQTFPRLRYEKLERKKHTCSVRKEDEHGFRRENLRMKRFIVEEKVFEILPGYCLGLVVARGLDNARPSEVIGRMLEQSAVKFAEDFRDVKREGAAVCCCIPFGIHHARHESQQVHVFHRGTCKARTEKRASAAHQSRG